MPTPNFSNPPSTQQSANIDDLQKQVSGLQDYIVKMIRDLNYLTGNLDTQNVTRLDAKVLVAESVTADKIGVNELSAITANLGTILAGLLKAVTIIGSLIQTAEPGIYPRIELSSSENLFKAMLNPSNYIRIVPFDDGHATIDFTDGSYYSLLFQFGQYMSLISPYKLNIKGTQGTEIYNVAVDGKVKLGTLSATKAGSPTAEVIQVVFNELIDKLKAVGIFI